MAKKTSKKKSKSKVYRGKRKQAVARVHLRKEGSGKIYYNGSALTAVSSPCVRQIVSEPLRFVDAFNCDAFISVSGGGVMGQAQAARVALSHALVDVYGDELKKKMLDYDRTLIIEDPRRVEPKKFKGPKARARFTKSYR
ncbi:30S ribosomal protein S9 [Candidatus Micrarchaeota archaeon]|nr:30S ribosomal protein S9 [Candidatus Micrarchaeota archaeon]